MKSLLSLFLFTAIVSAQLSPQVNPGDYANTRRLVPGFYDFYWNVNETAGWIEYAVIVNVLGWVGLGVSTSGLMVPADVTIGSVVGATVQVEDRWNNFRQDCISGSGVCLDTTLGGTNNIIAFGGQEVSGQTQLKWRRPIVSADPNDVTITPGPLSIIYAYSSSDPLAYHGITRGIDTFALLPVATTAQATTAVPTTAQGTTGTPPTTTALASTAVLTTAVAATTVQATTVQGTTAQATTVQATTAQATTLVVAATTSNFNGTTAETVSEAPSYFTVMCAISTLVVLLVN
jgi:hypothetical protein